MADLHLWILTPWESYLGDDVWDNSRERGSAVVSAATSDRARELAAQAASPDPKNSPWQKNKFVRCNSVASWTGPLPREGVWFTSQPK